MRAEKSDITFESCLPIESDGLTVMTWRNDPVTLAMSFHREAKVWPAFWREFTTTYFSAKPAFHPVFALLEGRRVGFLRFDIVPHPESKPLLTLNISINICPDDRGQGLGRRILRASLDFLCSAGAESVFAEIRPNNAVSIKAFRAVGFESLGSADKLVQDTGEVVRIERFLFDLGAQSRGRWPAAKAVFFDLDGTLADSLSVLRSAYYRFLERYGVVGTEVEFQSLNGPPLEQIVRSLAAIHDISRDCDALAAEYSTIIDELYKAVVPTAGAMACLGRAQALGLTVGIVTSNSKARAEGWLDIVGFSPFVDFIVGGDDFRQGKPSPEPYLLAAGISGFAPQEIVVIEDSLQGARSARLAGLKTYLVGNPTVTSPILTDVKFVRTLDDVFPVDSIGDAISEDAPGTT